MKFSSVFSPVHQGHQQLIRPTQFRRSPEVTQPFLNDFEHLFKRFSLYACQTFEIRVLQVFDRFISHLPIMAHLCKRSIMFSHDKITPMTHAEHISSQLNVKPSQVTAVISLLDDGNTVPFIARYRKEMTGSLDDEQIRIIADELIRLRALDERRASILASIEEQGKLTSELRESIDTAVTMTALEDLYAPYKKKRSTRAMVAREKGLEPLAEMIIEQPVKGSPEAIAENFLNDQVTNVSEALQGARDIVAERISDNA